MRILYIFSLLQSLDGTPRALKEIKSLIGNGYDVVVISFGKSKNLKELGNLKVINLKIPNVKLKFSILNYIFKILILPFMSLYIFFYILYFVVKIKPQIYFCYGFNFRNILLPFVKFITKSKFIVDFPELYIFNYSRIKFVGKILEHTIKLYLKYADTVLTIPLCEEIIFINRNSIVLYNYPEFEDFKSRIISKKKDNTILYIGNISERKGILNMIKALARVRPQIPQVRLLLIGPAEDSTKMKVLRYLNKYNLNSNVVLHDPIPYFELSKFLQKSRIGLYLELPREHVNPSKIYPTKLFMYMKYSIPVIGSNFPSIKEIIEKNNCGIVVDPTSPEEIADAIIYLLNNPKNIVKMGKNGKKAFKIKYSWLNEEKKLINALKVLFR